MTTMRKSSKTAETLRSDEAYAVSVGSGHATASAFETWFAATTACQHEMISFVSMRLEKDGESAREVMACKNLTDVATIQSRWVEETIRDYGAEMTKLLTVCAKSINGRASIKG
jgi:hypothetical protein